MTTISQTEYRQLIAEKCNRLCDEMSMKNVYRDCLIKSYEKVYPRIHCFRCDESIYSYNYEGSGNHHRRINCHDIREIPSIHNLAKLVIYDCPRLTTISTMRALVYLDINNCPRLKSIPAIHGLKTLYINRCEGITSIPTIIGLKELLIFSMSALTSIPIIPRLKVLGCNDCPSLKSIPFIEGLQTLSCGGSENLELIPTNAIINRLPKKATIMIKHGEYLTSYRVYKAYLTICIQYKRYKLKQQEMLRMNQHKTFLEKCTHKLRTIVHGRGKRHKQHPRQIGN